MKDFEMVEFVASEKLDVDNERNKIVMWNAPNGDLYISICPESNKFGSIVRIERSGGAKTRNPRLVAALTAAFDAIKETK